MVITLCSIGNVRGLVARKRLAQAQAEKALSMIKGVLDYSEFRDVDMVIEAVIENVPLKQKIFIELEKVCPPLHLDSPWARSSKVQDLAGYGVAVAVGKEFAKDFPDRTFRSPITDLMIKSGRNGNFLNMFRKRFICHDLEPKALFLTRRVANQNPIHKCFRF
ncbi:putative isomerase, 3-hydroxyacyl-CoA dehydrogenase, Enoyl-CoA hydratase [Helianthus annuus]|nr:putative isomerase, 3-hydroxyacyl-CoA dehydrogenase, Enoyl-CoA hydratase [Helianthus annuus]